MTTAIETVYQGYRMRSRLEARWAVFFDTLGIRWEYEPEGFDLGEAGWYLPDFWLPERQYWIEIKPTHLAITGWCSFETAEDPTIPARCGALAEVTARPVYLLTGPPGDAWSYDHGGDMAPYLVFLDRESADDAQLWCECPACGAIDLCYSGDTSRCYCGCGKWASRPAERLAAAYQAARSARFEYGEQPGTWRSPR